MGKLKGKVALVTGAGGKNGIGRAIALKFAEEGANVVVTDVGNNSQIANDTSPKNTNEWNGILSLAAEIKSMGVESLAVFGDAKTAHEVDNITKVVMKAFKKIDILVCNAAARPGGDRLAVVDLESDAFDEVFDVNVRGTFLYCRSVAREMIKQKSGKILIMSSCLGKKGRANYAAYSSSKFALIGFTESLALELGMHGINVNALCPGPIDTERFDKVAENLSGSKENIFDIKQKIFADRVARTPLGRIGTVNDVAKVAAFMASSDADFLTGSAINITGGYELT